MKIKHFIIVIGISVVVVLTFSGCTKKGLTEDNHIAITKESENMETFEEVYKPIIINNYGRELVIESKPEKVLTLGPNCSELFVALGLTDYIIGNSLDNHSREPLPEYAEEYAKIPELNYSFATREAVLSSGADFIYGIDWEFGSGRIDVDEIDEFGINAYMNAATTFDDIYKEIDDLGIIFGIKDRSDAFINSQKERISYIHERVYNEDTVRVLVYDSGGAGVFTCGGTNFETLLIEAAGGENIFSDLIDKQWITVSYEEVLNRNPDVIVVHDYDSPSLEVKIEEIKADPILSQLDCVKKERFVPITLESVLPGSRMAYTIEKFAEGFYPDKFK